MCLSCNNSNLSSYTIFVWEEKSLFITITDTISIIYICCKKLMIYIFMFRKVMWLLTLVQRIYTGSVRIILIRTISQLRSHFVYIVRDKRLFYLLFYTAIFPFLSLEHKNRFLLWTRYRLTVEQPATWELNRDLWKISTITGLIQNRCIDILTPT